MLTKLTVQNFKLFKNVEIELGQHVVFVGPNNSGKTSALQALALWQLGLQRLSEVPSSDSADAPYLNRYDLVNVPVPDATFLWHNVAKTLDKAESIAIRVEGIANNRSWSFGIRFLFHNPESIYCASDTNVVLSTGLYNTNIIFANPMSGLAAVEPRLEPGRINVLIGEGRTAEVLRNLCLQLVEANGKLGAWDKLVGHIRFLFHVELLPPVYLPGRGEIRMSYRDAQGLTFDLSASGRGMLQLMLLLAYLYANPGAVLLLDEPDAHLEIIRQREVYHLLAEVAHEQGAQIIAATHSEAVLEEAAKQDMAIAFVGQPHRIDTRNRSQVVKALREIRSTDYYLAERTGWVLYLEGSTDLAILRTVAERLNHPAAIMLRDAFIHYLETNKPAKASDHFKGLQEALPHLVGLAIFDRVPASQLRPPGGLTQVAWERREIENYLLSPAGLLAYAQAENADREAIMQAVIDDLVPPIALRDPHDRWWSETKASDEFLNRAFELYYERLALPNLMRKSNFHVLARYLPASAINPELIVKLDAIVATAKQARPRTD